MEEKLVRFESLIERTEHESSRLRWVVVFVEVRQSSSIEAHRTPSSIYVLIAQTEQNLSKIGLRSLWFRSDHFVYTIQIWGYFFSNDFLHTWRKSAVELQVYVEFERIHDSFTSLMQVLSCYFALTSILIEGAIVHFVDLIYFLLYVFIELFVRHAVSCPHCERIRSKPHINYTLSCRDKLVSCIWADLEPNRVNQTTSTWTDDLLRQGTTQQLTFAYKHGIIISIT